MTFTPIQQVQGSAVASYGIGTTSIATQDGSDLLAFIGWNQVTSASLVNPPAVNVTDSADNLWQQVGITQAGAVRSAIWACHNAQPVSWVSVGFTGFTRSAAWSVVEGSGLPQALALDFSVSESATGNGPSLSPVASQADTGLAVIAAGITGETFASLPPAGWAELTAASAGTAVASGVTVLPLYGSIAAGTAPLTMTLTTSAQFACTYAASAASASPPPQPNINFPFVQVEAAFGATPGLVSSSLDYLFSAEYITWTDLTGRILGGPLESRITTSRGRQYQISQEEAGKAVISFHNFDGALTPSNPGSPYYSNALNANMSFQSGIAPWGIQNGAVIAQSSAQAFASATGVKASFSMAMNGNGVSSVPRAISETLAITVNDPYSASAWVFVSAGYSTGCAVVIIWRNSAGGVISTSTGTVTSIPAGTWTQVTLVNATPPSGAVTAVLGVQAQGTPSAGITFFIAEAAIVAGPVAVRTGLVTLEVPVRDSCWWNGRRYPLWAGYIERWPQEWPDLPQKGFSKITATDAISVAAAGQMLSALDGDILADNPYAYIPCEEQYTTAVVGSTVSEPAFFTTPSLFPADANGLTAINRAAANQVTGTYFDGTEGFQVSTGAAMNFQGDNGTGVGATGYSNQVSVGRGPGMTYTDPGLAAAVSTSAGFSIEFWFTFDGATQACTLLTAYGKPSSFTNGSGSPNGAVIAVQAFETALVGYVGQTQFLAGPGSLSPNAAQCVITVTAAGTASIYVNGALSIAPFACAVQPVPQVITLGPRGYTYDGFISSPLATTTLYDAFNYGAGKLAVYPYVLSAQRIASHYATGSTGMQGSSAAQRYAQILTWAQLGLKRGGWHQQGATGTAEITQMGPAYQLSGSGASDAVNNVSQSEGGQYFVQANGSLVYLERNAAYNLSAAGTLGDNAAGANALPLNTNPGFLSGGVTGWTAQGGAVTATTAQVYGGYGSMLLTPSGTGATALSPAVSVTAGELLTAGAWLYSPAAGTASAGLQCYSGTAVTLTNARAYSLAPASWTYIPLGTASTVPAGTTGTLTASVTVGASGTAPVYASYAALYQASAEIPFLKDQGFDFDNTYLYNEASAMQQAGANTLVIYDNRNTGSQQAFFRRSALSFQPNVVSAYDVSDITTYSLAEYSEPGLRVSSVTIDAASNPQAAFPVCLALSIGDIVTVVRRPIGGAVITTLGIIERVSLDIGPRRFRFTYQVSPYTPGNSVLCADTAGFSTPATTTLAWLSG